MTFVHCQSQKIRNQVDSIDKGYIPFNNDKPFRISYLECFVKKNPIGNIYPRFIEDGFYYIDNEADEIAIPIRFNEAYPFINKCALVKYNDKYGVINQEGKYVIEPIYAEPKLNSWINPFIISLDTIVFDLNLGTKMSSRFYNPNFHAHPLGSTIYVQKVDDKYGLMTDAEEFVVKPQFDSIFFFDEYLDIALAQKKNKIGIINSKNDIVQPFEYDSIILGKNIQYNMHVYALYKKGKWYYFSPHQPETELFSSPHKIIYFRRNRFSNGNLLGIYKIDSQYNALSIQGKSFPHNYDMLSEDALVGIRNNIVYLIFEDGTEIPYYSYPKKNNDVL